MIAVADAAVAVVAALLLLLVLVLMLVLLTVLLSVDHSAIGGCLGRKRKGRTEISTKRVAQ